MLQDKCVPLKDNCPPSVDKYAASTNSRMLFAAQRILPKRSSLTRFTTNDASSKQDTVAKPKMALHLYA